MSKICNTCSPKDRWYPYPISSLEDYLAKLFVVIPGIKNVKALRKNIAYNLQYIEFQVQLLNEMKVSSVLLTQTWKTMIITGMSIIETIIYYILVSKNLHKKTCWNEKPDIKIEQQKTIDGVNYKIQNLLYKKNDEKPEYMNFDSMIKIVLEKRVLGNNNEIYKKLNYLRKLRNKIHLHLVENDRDTDWHSFNIKDIKLLKEILYSFLVSSYFKPNASEKEIFSFLMK